MMTPMVSSRPSIEETGGLSGEVLRYEEFVQEMQGKSGLASPGAATLVIEATLATLGERLRAEAIAEAIAEANAEEDPASGLIPELASLLPGRLSEALLGQPDSAAEDVAGREFSLAEFFERVGAATGVGVAEAERLACAVARTLEETVGDGRLDRLRTRLPDEYEFLFV